jgi:uncharacterized SAM-binding protein YcdF (DUF218 family)
VASRINTIQAITDLLFIEDEPKESDLIFVTGGCQVSLIDPAISLYRHHFAPKIMVSGGSDYTLEPGEKTEAQELVDKALSEGIPSHALLQEDTSTNTLENIVSSSPIIEREIGWKNIKRIIFCCKNYHSRRLLMTAQNHWPDHVEYLFIPVIAEKRDIRKEDWWTKPEARRVVLAEVRRISEYALKGDITV